MKNIFSIIVIIASIAAFVLIVKPQYDEIQVMQERESELEVVLDNARELQRLRDGLLEKRNQLSQSDLDRLEKLIPENSDNVKLILELQRIADQYNLEIQTASSQKDGDDEEGEASFDVESKDYGIITLEFTIQGGYADFVNFLEAVESNIRITDLRSLSISPNASEEATQTYAYQMSVQTYWLKDNI